MGKQKTFDDELRQLLNLLDIHNIANESSKDKLVSEISDWYDENAAYLTALDMGLHQEIRKVLDDGVITDEEYDILTAYILDYLYTHKHFDYKSYKKGNRRLTREEIKNISLYSIGDKDFIGKTIVITGVFDKFPDRTEAEREIRRRGGKTAQSISSKTNIVIYGKKNGWAKIEQVKIRRKQGQNIILVDEETFYKMLESNEAIDET